MIDEKETFKRFGYSSTDLKLKSNKMIVAICDNCGKIRELQKISYNSLCLSCSKIGKNNYMYEKHHTDKTKKKISMKKLGKKLSKDHCDNIKKNHVRLSGENHPMYGKHHTDETKRKISRKGKDNPNWKGGISHDRYCYKFNSNFKIKIRNKNNNRCFLCGKMKEKDGRNLDVHHVNYNKDCMCGSQCDFIILCRSCHIKTNYNRKYWEDVIMNYLHPNRFFMIEI